MPTFRFRAGRVAAALTGIALLCATSATGFAQSNEGFDLEYPSVYQDWRYESTNAYDGKRYDQAFEPMQKAACAGDKESQWMLGQMYLRGQGVDRDDMRGYAWVKVAAEFQSATCRKTASTIEQAIDAAHKEEAAKLSEQLIDEYGIRTTHMSCTLASSRQGHVMDRIACVPRYQGKMVLLKRFVGAPIVAK
ncbi:MAG: hypothetical protein ACREPX_12445 [Rhodanobacteraceae bacterium]